MRAKRELNGKPAEPGAPLEIDATCSGEWVAAEELRKVVSEAIAKGRDAIVNLAGVDHLDASAFQVLLAFAAAQKRQGRSLRLVNASSALRDWFGYAGAVQRLSCN
jgi:anti-anti-sigma factor